jgi:hypothetical protein
LADTSHTGPRPDPSEPAAGGLVRIHSVQEEYFHLMVRKCVCGGPWFSHEQIVQRTGDRLVHHVTARCAKCGKERTFHFALPGETKRDRPAPIREINPTNDPSEAVDAAEWMDLARFYLERIERLKDPTERAQSLLDARGCIEEALKFCGPNDDALPPQALWSDASRRKVAKHPDAYRREALEAMLTKMPTIDKLQQADAMEQREFRKALKETARRRVGRRWWEFWKRGSN